MIQELAYNFAASELEPHAAEWDKKKHFPKDVYKKAAELGFASIYVKEENGGCGLGRLESTLIFEGLATGKQNFFVHISRLCWFVCIPEHSQHVFVDD